MNDKLDIGKCIIEVPFVVKKLRNPNCLWINKGLTENQIYNINEETYLQKQLGVITPNCFFQDLELTNREIKLTAEHYGGEGVGFNGGGVRCGNLENNIQLKGIGVTPVVGKHDNLYNSYGAYPLYEAITEAVNHQIYTSILPIKPVTYIAIYAIGNSPFFVTADKKSERQTGTTPLAIGVREKAIRLGHFLPSKFYIPIENHKYKLMTDKERVQKANESLFNIIGHQDRLIELVNTFLKNTAQQFAFCLANRIAHGALTESNITIDGSWIDLTNTTIVPPGCQHITGSGHLQSNKEPERVLDIFCSFLDQFFKNTEKRFNLVSARSFYHKTLEHYTNIYVLEIFGLNLKEIDRLSKRDLTIFTQSYLKALHCYTYTLRGVPKNQENKGELEHFIKTVFRGLYSATKIQNPDDESLSQIAFRRIFFRAHQSRTNNPATFKAFAIGAAIKSLRRFHFSSYFFVGKIYLKCREVAENATKQSTSDVINHYSDFANWIFGNEDLPDHIFLFKNTNVVLYFTPSTLDISIKATNKDVVTGKIDNIQTQLLKIDHQLFMANNFDFFEKIIEILSFLAELFSQREDRTGSIRSINAIGKT